VALYKQALLVSNDLQDRQITLRVLEGLASAACLAADNTSAAQLFGAVEALREEDTREQTIWHAAVDQDVASTRASLGHEAFAAAWAEGRAMTLEQAVAYALEERPNT
jgi:hypothetical protein